MTKAFAYTDPDSGVLCVVHPVPGVSDEKVFEKSIPNGVKVTKVDSEYIPTDRSKRNTWKLTNIEGKAQVSDPNVTLTFEEKTAIKAQITKREALEATRRANEKALADAQAELRKVQQELAEVEKQ